MVAANSAPCGECYYCRRHVENLCEDLLFNNGAYAEFIRIPARIVERNTHVLPPHVTYQDAAMVEPLACVLRGLEETSVRSDDTVVVIGLGPIGLMFVRLAHVKGARVIAIGRRQTQLDRAARMGAEELLLSNDSTDLGQVVRDLTGGRGADIAIEAGGCPNDSRIALDTSLLHYSEITCKASFHHTPGHIQKALASVSRGEITARDFVNGAEPLANLLGVMRHLMSHNGHMKTAIVP